MVNYCIQRRLLRGEKAPSENEGSSKSRQRLSGLFDDLSSSQELSRDGSKLDKFSSFLEKLIDGDEPLFEPTDKVSDMSHRYTSMLWLIPYTPVARHRGVVHLRKRTGRRG